MSYKQENIRNFSIIAHIDHGKSTLADRLIQKCGGLEDREMKEQVLDSMELERERGITIKSQAVKLTYKSKKNGEEYVFNLMDTPGHVDFSYEVSRSLASCEGALLVVDASQGVEAQTLANVYQAIDNNLEILPVINKIDLPAADPDRVKEQIEDVIGIDASNAMLVSAKSGIGIDDLMEAIVDRLPPPKGSVDDPLKALLVDSWYDAYLGVVVLVRVFEGNIKAKDKLKFINTGATYEVDRVGVYTPKINYTDELQAGNIGFITCGIKEITETKIGDTITHEKRPCTNKLPGFKPSIPMVFCSMFPVDSSDYEKLKESLGKLALNDAALHYEVENSTALGMGFRCGFLGLLHLEIIQERLEREYDLDIIPTAPSVVYKVYKTNGTVIDLYNPADLPDLVSVDKIEEPWIKATILVPDEYLGGILTLCQERRGIQQELTWVGTRAMAVYKLPLNEVVFDFYDRLKSISRGYASMDYALDGFEEGDLVKLQILVNSEPVDALSMITHKAQAVSRGRMMCERLKELIPRQMFKIAIQAAIGGTIVAREDVSAFRKDVTAKCYGGDITRKRKLLEKQKAGKKKMRQYGNVEIPQSAFIAALRMSDDKK